MQSIRCIQQPVFIATHVRIPLISCCPSQGKCLLEFILTFPATIPYLILFAESEKLQIYRFVIDSVAE